MCLVVDLPIHGAQLHPTHKDGCTDDQAQKGDPKEVLKEKTAQGKEVVAKQPKEAQVEDKILFMAKRLRYVFGDGSRTYTPRKRLCDVFGDGSRRSAVGEPIPIKRPTKIGNVAYNEKDQVPTENDIHPHHQILIGNEMQSNPNSSNSRSPGIRLTVDLPIGGSQLHPHLVSNNNISTNDQAQKGEREKILEEKAKKKKAQEKEIALATVAIAKQQKKAEIKENIRGSPGIRLTVDLPICGAQLQPPLVSNKEISTNDQTQKGKREKILEEKEKKEAAQKKDAAQEKEVAIATVAIAKQQKKAKIKENIGGSPGIRLTVDLPIGGAQLQPPLMSNKEISTNDQGQKGKREKILEEKAKKEVAQKKDAAQEKEVALAAVAIAKQQKKAKIKENIEGSPGIRLTVDLPIGGAQLQPPLVSNKEISTNDQAQKGEREKILKEKAKKEAAQKKDVAQEKEVALAKQQKKAEIEKNIQIMAKRLRYVFGDGSRTYTPRKRLCDVFGEGSRKSGPIKTVNTTYNEKDQTSTRKDSLPPQPLYGNRMHSDQNSYYSRISPIKLTVDLPISSPMTTTPQGREVVAIPVTLEEGVGDNIAKQQQQAKAGRAIRDDVVPVVKYRRPDLNFHPPEEDDEDYYS
uniref:GI20420 n=1 Tax=Solanum tuberosum TaxID=4113 RepID=M0ZZQ1_SOLTU